MVQTTSPKPRSTRSKWLPLLAGLVGFTSASIATSTALADDKPQVVPADLALPTTEDMTEAKKGAPVLRIVLTGGPCGGKTTAMAFISERLRSLGYRVYRVPEAASILLNGSGVKFASMSDDEVFSFQLSLIKVMMSLEDAFIVVAKSAGLPSVVLCDRGTMDPSAYMSREQWQVILDESSWNLVELRDKRYDAVIHMVTAAIGAERFYTTENNSVRTETPEHARELDIRVLNAWIGHPQLRIIDNSTDFAQKIHRTANVICQLIGAPRPANFRRKFISAPISLEKLKEFPEIRVEQFEVEQVYLAPFSALDPEDPGAQAYQYVRRRGQKDSFSYTHHRHTPRSGARSTTNTAQILMLARAISGRDYLALLKQSDHDRVPVKKVVHTFTYKNLYYELETILEPQIGLTILAVEVDPRQPIEIPPFLKIKGEVTDDPEFSSYYISKHYKNMLNKWKDDEQMLHKYLDAKMKFVKKSHENHSVVVAPVAGPDNKDI